MRKILALSLLGVGVTLFNPCYATAVKNNYINDNKINNNKETVIKLFDAVVNNKSVEQAYPYLGRTYTEHSPHAEDGIVGMKHLIEYFKNTYPQAKGEIKRVIADGDYVLLHVHEILEPGSKGLAVAEIFRLDHGKVVEHWDVSQDVPESPENPNGMF